MRAMNIITLILIILGGLNWLSVGLAGYDVAAGIFGGAGTIAARVAYVIVGLSALWQLMPMVSSFTEGEIAAERHIRHQ
ncbi:MULTISPECIES: DUF378 domain-containing protein [unclassified Mesorhizobium]|uniref:DUF378 domain-containing protein n=1 Tax=unclassified Mesorhizobium TaxID=325217 RepID=UPI000FD9FA75|nr:MULTISPECIES: DUF378 domain-containing protein [unclassified Mesorhizobium]TGQ33916.1 DUF378 domain-containing protein [Mesorhizobium sp. M00.F.Ca.ET.216.01.1.1]TIS57335.1 MAG: DUF378 domain-containing protein [Mesorhizobium sp.]TIS91650.1 MAG: DUF378 domain-containing protein [Mesorhizobium sp.]TJW10072.1 MAG: DUF378 domain-containing protein [Mesorhizobium sp.]TJW41005.1 MAG: DUF378 domain-containing protein [Mesorhizobium sp.]